MRHGQLCVFAEKGELDRREVCYRRETDALGIGGLTIILPYGDSECDARPYLLAIREAVDEALRAHPAPEPTPDALASREWQAWEEFKAARVKWEQAVAARMGEEVSLD